MEYFKVYLRRRGRGVGRLTSDKGELN